MEARTLVLILLAAFLVGAVLAAARYYWRRYKWTQDYRQRIKHIRQRQEARGKAPSGLTLLDLRGIRDFVVFRAPGDTKSDYALGGVYVPDRYIPTDYFPDLPDVEPAPAMMWSGWGWQEPA